MWNMCVNVALLLSLSLLSKCDEIVIVTLNVSSHISNYEIKKFREKYRV